MHAQDKKEKILEQCRLDDSMFDLYQRIEDEAPKNNQTKLSDLIPGFHGEFPMHKITKLMI